MDVVVWRHPRPHGAEGRCIGRTDLPVDRRKAKRLAHRIRGLARREGLQREVWTSPLQRCVAVGRWLARWGWRHCLDARLAEMDFGTWDGCWWAEIPKADIDAWCADFSRARPGGGEALESLLDRCASFLAEPQGRVCLVVSHGGWITAASRLARGERDAIEARTWTAAVDHGACVDLRLARGAHQARIAEGHAR